MQSLGERQMVRYLVWSWLELWKRPSKTWRTLSGAGPSSCSSGIGSFSSSYLSGGGAWLLRRTSPRDGWWGYVCRGSCDGVPVKEAWLPPPAMSKRIFPLLACACRYTVDITYTIR